MSVVMSACDLGSQMSDTTGLYMAMTESSHKKEGILAIRLYHQPCILNLVSAIKFRT